METRAINRREFMKRSAIFTTLATAGRLPLLGAELKGNKDTDIKPSPAAVEPITGYLSGFTPATGNVVGKEDYALTYNIVHWTKADPRTGMTKNHVVGSLAVKRYKHNHKIHYEVNQKTNFGRLHNIIEAKIICADDDFNTLLSWGIRTYSRNLSGNKLPLSEMNETGENKAGRIQVKDGKYLYSFIANHPVVSQWTVLDFLVRRAVKTTSVTFDLLQDLSLFKANQTIFFDETAELTVKDGRKLKLDCYAQIGEGILPIHYMLDREHRLQLITSSLVSWSLQDLS